MEDANIISQTLSHLDGWVTTETSINLNDSQYNKIVSSQEVLDFYESALAYAYAYTQRDTFDDISVISDTAIIMWNAGLLWNKYNIRTNNQLDETNTLGFGDKLIIQAKEMLKPYKKYQLNSW